MCVNAFGTRVASRFRALLSQKGFKPRDVIQEQGVSAMQVRTMAAVFAFVAAAVTGVFAQETTGAVRGRIVDAQGLPVPGVTVTATGPQGVQTAVSDADGRFSFPF